MSAGQRRAGLQPEEAVQGPSPEQHPVFRADKGREKDMAPITGMQASVTGHPVLVHVILPKLKTDEESSSPSQEFTGAVCTLGARKLQLRQK